MKENLNKLKNSALIDRVDDGFNYFYEYRLEELKSDDRHYIKAFMDYINHPECKVDKQAKALRKLGSYYLLNKKNK